MSAEIPDFDMERAVQNGMIQLSFQVWDDGFLLKRTKNRWFLSIFEKFKALLMKKIVHLLLIVLICNSCYKSKTVEYSATLDLVNNTGRTIEIFKGNNRFVMLRNQETVKLFERTQMYEFVDMDMLLFSNGEREESVSIYDASTGELLREWRYSEREQPGKQLYRLCDSDAEVYTEKVDGSYSINNNYHSSGHFYIRYH